MNRYTIHCTEEQTKKALELGAPIEFEVECPVNLETFERSPYPDIKMGKDGEPILINPTAEELIGWLEEQEDIKEIFVTIEYINWHCAVILSNGRVRECDDSYDSRKEATLAAIDAALDYLKDNKK